MSHDFTTKKGYDFFEVISAMQKEIRRGNAKMAAYWAVECFVSGYHKACWNRLYIISAEDTHGLITNEIESLRRVFDEMNGPAESRKGTGGSLLFIAKAAYLLAISKGNRDIDNLFSITYERGYGITDEEVSESLKMQKGDYYPKIPDYALDKHTKRGKAMGRTCIEDFIADEYYSLNPKQTGLFDDITEEFIKEESPSHYVWPD